MSRGITVNRWKPILWYVKPPRALGTTLNDSYDGTGMEKQHHEWGQSVGEFYPLLERIAAPGDVVCDPFLGGGTTALAAMQHRSRIYGIYGIRYYWFTIDSRRNLRESVGRGRGARV